MNHTRVACRERERLARKLQLVAQESERGSSSSTHTPHLNLLLQLVGHILTCQRQLLLQTTLVLLDNTLYNLRFILAIQFVLVDNDQRLVRIFGKQRRRWRRLGLAGTRRFGCGGLSVQAGRVSCCGACCEAGSNSWWVIGLVY